MKWMEYVQSMGDGIMKRIIYEAREMGNRKGERLRITCDRQVQKQNYDVKSSNYS